jgi:probable addiction module antidote protein
MTRIAADWISANPLNPRHPRSILSRIEQRWRTFEASVVLEQKAIETRTWDAAEHLETEADMAAYLDAALEDGDTTVIVAALGDIARARGMAQIARETGLGRESLYKALSASGNPEFATILKVVRALGLQFHVHPVQS